MGLAGRRTWLDLPASAAGLLGAKLSVWCDAPDSMSPAETWERLRAWLKPYAASFRADQSRV